MELPDLPKPIYSMIETKDIMSRNPKEAMNRQ